MKDHNWKCASGQEGRLPLFHLCPLVICYKEFWGFLEWGDRTKHFQSIYFDWVLLCFIIAMREWKWSKLYVEVLGIAARLIVHEIKLIKIPLLLKFLWKKIVLRNSSLGARIGERQVTEIYKTWNRQNPLKAFTFETKAPASSAGSQFLILLLPSPPHYTNYYFIDSYILSPRTVTSHSRYSVNTCWMNELFENTRF